MHIRARNVNDAYYKALNIMNAEGELHSSRNGVVKRVMEPVLTTYEVPRERMLLDPYRDANPFFHIFEGLWMLAGRHEVAFPAKFAGQIKEYSDDGDTLGGAYGYRWRNFYHNEDQILHVIELLRKDSTTRRAVIDMYHPPTDNDAARRGGKDIPCNTTIYFSTDTKGLLDMTVCCRSNDIIWGCYGANAVHMSMLHEFVSEATGLKMGRYHQFSNDWHIYERHFPLLTTDGGVVDYPREPWVQTYSLDDSTVFRFLRECEQWVIEHARLDITPNEYSSRFIKFVAIPMYEVWSLYKGKDIESAMTNCSLIKDPAIRLACYMWLQRRLGK